MRGGVGARVSPPRCRAGGSDATLAIPRNAAAVRRWPVPASPRQRKCSGRRDVSEECYASVSRCTFSCRVGEKNQENNKNLSFPPAAKVKICKRKREENGTSVLFPLHHPKVRNRGFFFFKEEKWSGEVEQWGWNKASAVGNMAHSVQPLLLTLRTDFIFPKAKC